MLQAEAARNKSGKEAATVALATKGNSSVGLKRVARDVSWYNPAMNRLACLALLFCTALYSQTPKSDDSDRSVIARLEKQWNDAHVSGDADALDRLWADDLEVAVPKMPVMKKGELIAFVQSGRMKFLAYNTSDVNIRIFHQTAIVTGRLQRKRTINGNEVNDDWRFTKIYIRGDNGWRVASFHASEALNP
jgi:ketosteroid isomerase-like protein